MPSAALSPEAVLQQAIACHQAGQLAHAEHGYLAVLAAQPDHPDASHNLGIVRMQQEDVAAALPLFHAALHAQPSQGQFWVSYIGALIQVQQPDAARQVLAQGQALGLQGAPVDALAAKLHAVPAAEAPLAMPEVTAPALPSVSKPVKRGGRVITPWQHLAPSRPTPKKRAATPQKSPAQSAKRASLALGQQTGEARGAGDYPLAASGTIAPHPQKTCRHPAKIPRSIGQTRHNSPRSL